MSTYLLDTSVIIDVLNGKNGRALQLENLLKQGHTLAGCFINIAEIYAGMRPHEEARTRTFLESLDYMDVTWDIGRQAGLLKRDYARKGVTLALTDTILAAVAMSHGCFLITDNIKDFPMKGLMIHVH